MAKEEKTVVAPQPRKRVVAKTLIRHGDGTHKNEHGELYTNIVEYQPGAELGFDPRDPIDAELHGCSGLIENVHYELAF